MISKEPIDKGRVRKIRGSFSWIDHVFITGGLLEELNSAEILLYFFLVAVGDKNGVSFYHYSRICQLLKMDVEGYLIARKGLVEKSLIAYRDGVYQVLELPPAPQSLKQRPSQEEELGLRSVREILKHVLSLPKEC